ncbi:hypothetical protein B0H10DRAFT_2190060 [Mycena sp. CBHHK59/15]|nr:hypothetical protein B0H10DRAFT_2190060 [Mycena sp. CBHHK59/15]
MTASTDMQLSSLPDFVHEAFTQVIILTDDAVSDAALHKFWSPHVKESDVATSSHLSLAGFRDVVQGIRTQFTDRTFVKETFVIATPADPNNKAGAVAATHVFTGRQDGQRVTVTIVAVLRIKWVQEHGHHHGGRREVVTEAFIMNTSS